MIKRICKKSGVEFEITKDDLEFYEKMGVITANDLQKLVLGEIDNCVGLPTLCPEERQRRRMIWSNQMNLYKRDCSGTGKKIISSFDSNVISPVYDVSYFFSDDWDQLATGREFDFSRPFFDQFFDLLQVAPRPALQRSPEFDENSDYTNYAGKNKNCYLVFDSDKNRDCFYSYSLNNCENTVDSFRVSDSELSYENIDCWNCYDVRFSQNSTNCSESWFLKNCIGCNNCFGCVNLRNKEYYFLNQKCTKDEYAQKIADLHLGNSSSLRDMRSKFQQYCLQFPYKFMEGVHTESVLGNYLTSCKNAKYCFDSRKLQDCKYVVQGFDTAKNCMDCIEVGDEVELLYECYCLGYNGYNNRFCTHQLGRSSYLDYCYFTPYSSHCFGCVGIHHAQYRILNKQYTKEQYEALVPQIISYMKKTGEWGEFFPSKLSPFAYNETMAQDHLPLTKSEALEAGYEWKEERLSTKYKGDVYVIPDDIKDVPDEIVKKVLKCERSGKFYRIQKAELKFYRKMGLPIPRLHPDERHKDRIALRNPRTLWTRSCGDCGCEIQTTFAPDRPEKVLCEACYLKVVN